MNLRHKKRSAIFVVVIGLCLNLSLFHIHQLENLFSDQESTLQHQLTESTVTCPICIYTTSADPDINHTQKTGLDLTGVVPVEHQIAYTASIRGPENNKSPPLPADLAVFHSTRR